MVSVYSTTNNTLKFRNVRLFHSLPQSRNKLVVGIAGSIGAGKTTVAKYLASGHGFGYLRYSQVLAEWLGRGTNNRAVLQQLGWEIMSRGKQNQLNAMLIGKIRDGRDYAIDGLRHRIDYITLRKRFRRKFFLLYVDAPAALRWHRLRRNRKFGSIMQFRKADHHPVERRLRSLKRHASFVISNNGTRAELRRALDRVIQKIA